MNERQGEQSVATPSVRAIAEIQREIEDYFGYFPLIFEPARSHPVVLDLLWRQLWAAAIQNPIPAGFKARVYVERLRQIAAPGILAWHSCQLLDTGVEPHELLSVLEQPVNLPSDDPYATVLGSLTSLAGPLEPWPAADTSAGRCLLAAATVTLIYGPKPRVQRELQRLLGPQMFAQWSVLLMHIHAYTNWVHMHPELAGRPDPAIAPQLARILAEQPSLATWLDAPPEHDASPNPARFRLTDTTPTGVVQFAIDGTVVFANAEAQRMLAMSPDELSRITTSDLEAMSVWEPGLGDPPEHPVTVCLRTLKPHPSQCLGLRRAGEILWITLTVLPLRDPTSGEATGVMATMVDSNDRVRVRRRLADTEQLYEKLLATADSGVLVLDREGTVLRANDMVYALFLGPPESGSPPAEQLVGKRLTDILPDPEAAAVHLGRIAQVMRSGETVEFEDMFEIDGENRWFSFHAQPLRHLGFVYGAQIVARDITSKRRAEQALRDREERARHEALHDRLTRLPNRVLFLDRLAVEVIHAKQNPGYTFAVLVLDLDRFKNVNDSLGHSAGDRLLIEYSHRLRSCLGPEDTLARMGGDEFAILLKDVHDISDAIKIANLVLETLAEPFTLGSHDVYTPTSIGIAISQTGYNRPEDILRDADTAMYRAKSHGKGRYEVFDKAMHAEAVAMLTLESDLRRALGRNEFQLYYQPVIRLSTGELYGFEALVRWVHPLRGLVSPIDFIPLAEETGLILPIGEWVLREACHQMQRWHQQFATTTPLTISVNLSGKQFSRPTLIRRILRETALDPSTLKLEITESVIMDDPEAASAMLRDLLGDRIQSHVDDFGTGYSSLSYLHTFPTAALKIDRSFVSKIGPGGENSEIVRTIISLAHNLQMSVIAEGVETHTQLELIKQMGCEFGQGYYFSPPLNAAAAELLMLRGTAAIPAVKAG